MPRSESDHPSQPAAEGPDEGLRPDFGQPCESCGASPIVPLSGMCGPCTFGDPATAGGAWWRGVAPRPADLPSPEQSRARWSAWGADRPRVGQVMALLHASLPKQVGFSIHRKQSAKSRMDWSAQPEPARREPLSCRNEREWCVSVVWHDEPEIKYSDVTLAADLSDAATEALAKFWAWEIGRRAATGEPAPDLLPKPPKFASPSTAERREEQGKGRSGREAS